MTKAVYTRESHFGECPDCGHDDGNLNVGSIHYFVCHEHRHYWRVGENLFSGWRDDDPLDSLAVIATLDHYREVEPIHVEYSSVRFPAPSQGCPF